MFCELTRFIVTPVSLFLSGEGRPGRPGYLGGQRCQAHEANPNRRCRLCPAVPGTIRPQDRTRVLLGEKQQEKAKVIGWPISCDFDLINIHLLSLALAGLPVEG